MFLTQLIRILEDENCENFRKKWYPEGIVDSEAENIGFELYL